MIKNLPKYKKAREREYWNVLRRLNDKESIALAEALMTSELMKIAYFPDDDHPMSLAISLGIKKAPKPSKR